MKYETQILEAFDRLDFKPRERQVQDINEIITGFLDEGFKTIVLSAPTGTGKSIIGAVVAEVMHYMTHSEEFSGASFLLTPTNLLSEQYENTFQKGRDQHDVRFKMIKGAKNFICEALSTPDKTETADICTERVFRKEMMTDMLDEYCNDCQFSIQRRVRDHARHLITNYSYYFVDRMYTNLLRKRTVCVFDEAHMINDLFTEHNAVYFSDSRLKQMGEEIGEHLSFPIEVIKSIKQLRADLAEEKINEGTYLDYLVKLGELYKNIFDAASGKAENSVSDLKRYTALQKLAKKYFNLGCKIGDLLHYQYPHAFEFKKADPRYNQENEVSVKPIFVGTMWSVLENAEYNLLMSATISQEFVNQTLALGSHKFIRLKPSFPKENKRVVFYKPQNLTYNTVKSEEVLSRLTTACRDIVRHHMAKGERGIILAPSFALLEPVKNAIKGEARLFVQERGQKLSELVDHFRRYSGNDAVLMTPAGFEGLDLSDDLSRFQILLKAPFGSLGEARMRKILADWPKMYSLLTLMKLVQGAGRSVRGPTDHAITYMLDTNIQRLWTDQSLMEWKDEFDTRFSSMLE